MEEKTIRDCLLIIKELIDMDDKATALTVELLLKQFISTIGKARDEYSCFEFKTHENIKFEIVEGYTALINKAYSNWLERDIIDNNKESSEGMGTILMQYLSQITVLKKEEWENIANILEHKITSLTDIKE